MKLALVQMTAAEVEQYEETAQKILCLAEEACSQGAEMILFPECAYPAYMIGRDPQRHFLKCLPELLEGLSGIEAKYKVYIAVGAAFPEGKKLYNSVIVYGPDGKMRGKGCKSNLWHFDEKWFTAGGEPFLFDTEFGRIGVMICADGRVPEVARMLRLGGAQLILDAVNLVASAEAPDKLTNQQYQFILPIRAWENGVPIAVCGKAGVESGSVCGLGRSFIASSDGTIIAECSPDREEILVKDIQLPAPAPLTLRRPELYAPLCSPVRLQEQTRWLDNPEQAEVFAALIRFSAGSRKEYVLRAEEALKRCGMMDVRLAVLPSTQGFVLESEDLNAIGSAVVQGTAVVDCEDKDGNRRAMFLKNSGCAGMLAPTHSGQEEGAEICVLELLPGCHAAVMFDEEMAVPEIARVAMLKGADVILWLDRKGCGPDKLLAQTRAAENKVFILRSGPHGENERSYAVSPDGAQLFTSFFTESQITSGLINLSLSKCKTVVPGTHILRGRHPEIYWSLIQT